MKYKESKIEVLGFATEYGGFLGLSIAFSCLMGYEIILTQSSLCALLCLAGAFLALVLPFYFPYRLKQHNAINERISFWEGMRFAIIMFICASFVASAIQTIVLSYIIDEGQFYDIVLQLLHSKDFSLQMKALGMEMSVSQLESDIQTLSEESVMSKFLSSFMSYNMFGTFLVPVVAFIASQARKS